MSLVAVPFHAAAVLLIISGMAKVRSPRTVMPMLAIVCERVGAEVPAARRWSAHGRAGRALGVIEVLLGLGCLLGSRIVAFGTVVAFALLTDLLVAARQRGVQATCYSTAATSTPTVLHIVSNLVAAIAVFVAALGSDVPSIWDALGSGPLVAMPYLLAIAVGVAMVVRLAGPLGSGSVGAELGGRDNTEHWSESRR